MRTFDEGLAWSNGVLGLIGVRFGVQQLMEGDVHGGWFSLMMGFAGISVMATLIVVDDFVTRNREAGADELIIWST